MTRSVQQLNDDKKRKSTLAGHVWEVRANNLIPTVEWFIQEKHKLIYISLQGHSGVHMVEEVGFRGGGRGIRSQQQIFLERSRS